MAYGIMVPIAVPTLLQGISTRHLFIIDTRGPKRIFMLCAANGDFEP